MPLRSSNNRPDHHDDRKAIGFWMTVEGKDPVQPIRVFVTYEALRELDPSQPPNSDCGPRYFHKEPRENRGGRQQGVRRQRR